MASSATSSSILSGHKYIVYVLRCEEDNFYVGRVHCHGTDGIFRPNALNDRLDAHRKGMGAEWTKFYPMVELISKEYTSNILLEDNKVRELMLTHGKAKVRGGKYSQIRLSDEHSKELDESFRSARNECFKCGSATHFINQCPQTQSSHGNQDDYDGVGGNEQRVCDRCGHTSHFIQDCYATYDIYGNHLHRQADGMFCFRCRRSNHHLTSNCYARYDVDGAALLQQSDSSCRIL